MPAPLAFHILGPLQVTHADAPVMLGGPRERVLLAALLTEHSRVVSVDGLARALWGDRPPATGRHQVAIGVSRLRKAFATAGAARDVIATCAPGYLTAGGWLDARCFEERARQAHDALAVGNREEAARLLRAGLSLWRGPALTGIDRPFAEIEAARLEERRLLVTEECIGLELDLGRHEELVGDLLTLVRAHPLRERLRCLLMLALHQAERRAEALEVYQDGRRQLVDTLGIEPGPQLRAVHQALLRDEPARHPRLLPGQLGDPAPRQEVPPPPQNPAGRVQPGPPGAARHDPVLPVPAQLPPDVRGFMGRRAELDALDELAAMSGTANGAGERHLPIGIIAGVAGVGKTGLAVHWSHGAMRRFPDGQLYADLRGYDPHQEPLPPGVALDGFLRALGVPGAQIPGALDERAALFRSVIHGRHVLIVLDNARTPEQIRPLLPGSSSCLVLVSSRDRLDDLVACEGARLYPLGVLHLREASDLLSLMAGDRLIDPATANRIAALCGRLPLALRIAAARLAAHPLGAAPDLADRLADEQRRLAELSQTHRGVQASFALSYRALPTRAAMLFRLLGLLDAADVAAWTAAALMDASEQEAEDLLDQLVRAGLLEVAGRDCAGQVRYRLHDLMRLYARERSLAADGCDERRAAEGRLFGAALYLAERADRCLGNPFVFPLYAHSLRLEPGETVESRVLADPVAWFEAEHTLLTGAVAQATRLGVAGYAWELTSALGQFLFTGRYTDAWQDCAIRAAAAARAVGDARGEAAALLQYADWLGDVGRYGDAIRSIQRALALVSGCEGTEAKAVCRTLLAFVRLLAGQVADAEQEAQHALTLLGRSAPPAARGRALSALGAVYLAQDRTADAGACFLRVLRIQQAAGSIRGQAEARYRLGAVRLRQGRYAAAVRLLTLAMCSARQSGDLTIGMTAQIRLGQTFLEMGRLDDAQPLLENAVRNVTPEGSPRFRAIALEALAWLHWAHQQPEMAAPLAAEAAELWQALSASAR
jgi:DNA-binding SARP family transcriptional activator/tetratricopeptide (TPR) repeat protein